ncbi:MAG: 6,7-dimethyl-8-ribityllumazine synthase [Hyphomicrobiales bacterium]|nr:6,7-dimethyl-8-ribityllumazine synthase [Hyphomicrobiales bacterium]MCY4038641.1 6,7-dimethyl-8-ribityllumazine synthase [Hyphomicrobiales bacterium]
MVKRNFHIALVEARYYGSVSEPLMNSAKRALEEAGATHEHVWVLGALEVPAAVRLLHDSNRKFDGFVALGCVIRGETSHYDIVAEESARGLMDLSTREGILIGNAILTVNTRAQAEKRAMTKGGDAVKAVLSLLKLRDDLK